jgi:hypothetical protein
MGQEFEIFAFQGRRDASVYDVSRLDIAKGGKRITGQRDFRGGVSGLVYTAIKGLAFAHLAFLFLLSC